MSVREKYRKSGLRNKEHKRNEEYKKGKEN